MGLMNAVYVVFGMHIKIDKMKQQLMTDGDRDIESLILDRFLSIFFSIHSMDQFKMIHHAGQTARGKLGV